MQKLATKITKLGGLAVAAATTVGLLAGPAAAADPAHPVIYLGLAAGTSVSAADNTVVSSPTAQSYVQGFVLPQSGSNDIADAHVGTLLSTGAITTNEAATEQGSGAQLVSHAKTLGLNLLNGLITADVADTTSTAVFDGSTLTAGTTTTFANIKITNVNIPVNIPRNFTVDVPGVARIVLNYTTTYNKNGQVSTSGAGIYVRLLSDFGPSPLGTQIYINPSYAALTAHVPHSPVILGGTAYGTRLTVNAGDVVGINSGRTALQILGAGGTSGQTITNSTAGVNIPDVLTAGAVQTTIRGSHTNVSGDAYNTASVAGVNLFNGLITADAVKSTAHVHLTTAGMTITNTVRLVNLSIGGKQIPVTVSPNTRIDVLGLGTVTLNQQYGTSFDTNVRAIQIKLSTARAGLPVGAIVEVAFASAYIIS